MTTEQTQQQETNELDQAQRQLGGQEPQYVTFDQVQQLLTQQAQEFARQLTGQVGGLQSKLDTGLNAIRRDTKQWAEGQIGDLRTEIGRRTLLDSIPDEDTKRVMGVMLDEMDKVRGGQRATTPEPQAASANPPTTGADAQAWEQVRSIVRDMGVDPSAEGVDYQALSNPALTAQQRQTQFLQSVLAVHDKAASQGARAPAAAASPRPPGTANPPVGAGPRGVTSSGSVEEARDAFITGRDSLEVYRKKMKALGEPV